MPLSSVIHPAQPLNDVFYRNCGYHCLMTALNYFGRKYQLFIANAACAVELSRIKYIEQRHPDELLKNMAVNAPGIPASNDICADLVTCISNGALGLVHVDCFHMPSKKEFYQKAHWGHSILVRGYENNTFNIIDNETIFSTKYQTALLSFDALSAAYAGYLDHFNPHRSHTSFTTISENGTPADEDIRSIAIIHLKSIKQENTYENFSSAGVSDIIIAKKIERYKFENIIKNETLTNLSNHIIENYEHIRNVVAKMELRQTYNPALLQERLNHITELELQCHSIIAQL